MFLRVFFNLLTLEYMQTSYSRRQQCVRTSGCLTLLVSFGPLGLPAFPAMSKSSQVLNPCIEVVAITVHSARAGPVFLGLYNIRSDRVAAQSCYHWCKSITERRQVLFGFKKKQKNQKGKRGKWPACSLYSTTTHSGLSRQAQRRECVICSLVFPA